MKSQDPHLFSTRCYSMYRRVTPEKSGERKTSHLPDDYCQLSVQLAVLQLSNHLLTNKIGIDDRVLVIIDRRLTDHVPFPVNPTIDTMTRAKMYVHIIRAGVIRCRRKLNSLSSELLALRTRRVFCMHALRYALVE